MNVERELEIVQAIIQEALIEDESPWCTVSMDWSWDTNLREIIDFNDCLRGIGYKTTYEIYGDEGRNPHVVATFSKINTAEE